VGVYASHLSEEVLSYGLKNQTSAMGGALCQIAREQVGRGATTHVLSDCRLFQSASYFVIVYIEDLNGNGDGALSDMLYFTVPASSLFEDQPRLISTPTHDAVSLTFTATASSGKAWAIVLDERDVANATRESIKASMDAVGFGTCRREVISIGTLAVYWTLTGCNLFTGTKYYIAVYVEDPHNNNDGTLAFVEAAVPDGVSNFFVEVPEIVGQPDEDGVGVAFTGYAFKARVWLMLSEVWDAPSDILSIKLAALSLGGSNCKVAELDIDNTRQGISLTGCGLIPGRSYTLTVYVEDADFGNDGVFQSVDVKVPAVPRIRNVLAQSYDDFDVVMGSSYYYQIRAVNHIGVGLVSSPSSRIYAANVRQVQGSRNAPPGQ
jgi:hypothetical protein